MVDEGVSHKKTTISVFSPITIPAGSLFMRGYDTRYPFPSARPAYLTHDPDVAKGYAEHPGHSFAFVATTRDLQVVDVRYMTAVLRTMFASRSIVDEQSDAAIRTVSLSYGLCSLMTQIDECRARYAHLLTDEGGLLKAEAGAMKASIDAMVSFLASSAARSKFPVEVPGIRVAETTNDAEALLTLKDLMRGVDGYISPVQKSAFHVSQRGSAPAELVLFDPLAANVAVLTPSDVKSSEIRRSTIESDTTIHSILTPISPNESMGMDAVWVTLGGAKRRRRPKAVRGSRVFDPCGIDRIPEAQYKRMCKNAKAAAISIGAHTFALPLTNGGGGGGGGGRTDIVSTWPQISAPDFHPHARNLLESLTDDEYDAMRKRVLGEDHVARNPTPRSSHVTPRPPAASSSAEVDEALALLRGLGGQV